MVKMLGLYKWKQSILLSLFTFISGCMFTIFFMKIDDNNSFKSDLLAKFKPTTDISQLKQSKNENTKVLVIVIMTSIDNMDKRNAIRETWLQLCKSNKYVQYFFVIGSGQLSEEQRVNLLREQDKFNDLLLLPNVIDSFTYLTKKVLETFTWVDKNIHQYQYVLKCDDDSFLRVNELVTELKTNFNKEKGKNLYWGFFNGKASVHKQGKYREGSWNLCDHYLPYALGGGYVLSKTLIASISRNSNDLMFFKSEDVSVGVWLASLHVNRVHDCRFDTEFKSRGCSNQYLVTHKRTPGEMKELYTSLINSNKLCVQEYRSRPSYIYNWDVPPSQCCLPVMDDPDIP